MLELAAILNGNNFFGEYAARQPIATSGNVLASTTLSYGSTANAATNQTVACSFIPIQRMADYDKYRLEDTSRSGVSFVSFSELSSLEKTTEIHVHNWYNHFQLINETLYYVETQLGNELLISSVSRRMPPQVIQEKQETIRVDTNRALAFEDLVSALDRISYPTEIEDIPLSFDPDDYPVV